MKLTKTTIIAIMAAGGLLAFSPALRAQDTNKDAKSTETKTKKGGKRGLTIDQLKEQLKLTDEELPKFKVVWDDHTKKMQDLFASQPSAEDRRTKLQAINEETLKKSKEILTAEQYKQFEQILARGRGGKKGGGDGAPPAPKAPGQ